MKELKDLSFNLDMVYDPQYQHIISEYHKYPTLSKSSFNYIKNIIDDLVAIENCNFIVYKKGEINNINNPIRFWGNEYKKFILEYLPKVMKIDPFNISGQLANL